MLPTSWFTKYLLKWYDKHGRHDLPWQLQSSPYTIWLSEIMLQQTQVNTVLPYFENFIQSYPTIEQLAAAPLDDVLAKWSGLGYYARARNLHKAAQLITNKFAGQFPQEVTELMSLPGVGRSTAHAILSQAFQQPLAILDGNVKRVLLRFLGMKAVASDKKIEPLLWQRAQSFMPQTRCGDYTQAIMDLGALICKRSNPNCTGCPVQKKCQANQQGLQHAIPLKKTTVPKPVRETHLYLIRDLSHKILLEKRSDKSLWGNLWTLPGTHPSLFEPPFQIMAEQNINHLLSFRHTFTHFHLDIQAYWLEQPACLKQLDQQSWFTIDQALAIGIPAPIRKILQQYREQISTTALI
jgi:A/G-specific adenine glycosylase